MTDGAEVTSSSDVNSGYAGHAVSVTALSSPVDCRGCAIQNNRFWSKWRRDGDGARSLEQLLRQVERGAQVRGSDVERLLTELQQQRDATPDGDLRSALAWLCNAQSRIASDPTAAHSREVLLAAYEVKRVLATATGTTR